MSVPLTSVQAEPQAGLDVTVYNNFGYNGAPPLPEVSGRPVAGTTVFTNVDQDFDQSPPFGLYEDYIVQYTGYITSPVSASIVFLPTADDGTKLILDGVLIDNNWRDKGGGGNPTAPQQFTAGVPRQFTHWFYENGGGSWTTLYWDIGNGWEVVPAAAFTRTAEPQASVATTTTLAPYLNSPQNLTVTSTNETKIYLEWEAPEVSNADVERYAVFFSKDNWASGWAISSTQTSAAVEGLDSGTEYQFKVRADNDSLPVYSGWSNEVNGTTALPPITYSLSDAVWETSNEGSDLTLTAPDGNQFTEALFASYGTPTGSNGLYRTSQCDSPSSIAEVEAVFIGKTSATISADNGVFGDPCGGTYKYLTVVLKYGPVPSTTTSTTTTIAPVVTWPTVDTTTTTEVPVETPPSESNPESEEPSTSVPQYATPEDEAPTETTPEVVIPEETQNTADDTVDDIFAATDNADELGAAVANAVENAESPEELAALVTSLLDGPLSTEEFSAVIDSVFSEDLSTEELSAALDAVFDAPLSDEKFDEAISAVLDNPLTDEQFAEVVGVLESDSVSEEQVSSAVDTILENGVTADQATELATSEKVLESIDAEQATEIFEEIPVGELTATEEAALVAAVTNAPEEVKEAFEGAIDIYGEGLDDYVPTGSAVDVGTRRSLIAVTTALAAAGTAGGLSGTSNGGPTGGSSGGGGSGGSGGSPSDSNKAARREDEKEDEEAGGLEGPEDREKNTNTRNSIYTYGENNMKKFSIAGFIKKLAKETAALSFTFAGSAIMFVTLSGDTRRIAIIATAAAVAVHYIHVMLENDSE